MGVSCSTMGKDEKFVVNVSLSEKKFQELRVLEGVTVNSNVVLKFPLQEIV